MNSEPAAPEPLFNETDFSPFPSEPPGPAYPSWLPQDLRVPWGVREIILFFAFFLAVAVVIAPLCISLLLMAIGVTHEFVPHDPRQLAIFLLGNQVVLSAAVMGYLFVRLRHHYGIPFWTGLQWRPLAPLEVPRALAYAGCIGGGCTMALVIGIISEHLGKAAPMPIEDFFQNRDTAMALMLMSVLLAPLVEETFFRGFLYPVLARRMGVIMGVLFTGTLFGLMHSYQLGGNKAHVALLILVGVVLTGVRAISRTVLASFLVHFSYNGFLAFGYFVSTTFHQLPPHH